MIWAWVEAAYTAVASAFASARAVIVALAAVLAVPAFPYLLPPPIFYRLIVVLYNDFPFWSIKEIVARLPFIVTSAKA